MVMSYNNVVNMLVCFDVCVCLLPRFTKLNIQLYLKTLKRSPVPLLELEWVSEKTLHSNPKLASQVNTLPRVFSSEPCLFLCRRRLEITLNWSVVAKSIPHAASGHDIKRFYICLCIFICTVCVYFFFIICYN